MNGREQIKFSLFKHMAPITVSAITREIPFSSRATIYPGAMVCMHTELKLGVEKQRYSFSRGEVAYFAATGDLCFFTKDAKSDRPLNPIGRVDEGLEVLDQARIGSVLEIRTAQEAADQT